MMVLAGTTRSGEKLFPFIFVSAIGFTPGGLRGNKTDRCTAPSNGTRPYLWRLLYESSRTGLVGSGAVYNEERPHEALAFATPASVYAASTRRYPSTIPEPICGDRFAVRRVRNVWHINWQGGLIFLSEMLCHELVGLLPIEEGHYEVYFGPVLLGELDMDLGSFTRVR